MNSNLKDTLSTIAGILGAISGVILSIQVAGVVLPEFLITAAAILGSVSVGIIGWLTGKAPNAAKKTEDQVVAGNVPTPIPPETK